jgi:hypothetical protein
MKGYVVGMVGMVGSSSSTGAVGMVGMVGGSSSADAVGTVGTVGNSLVVAGFGVSLGMCGNHWVCMPVSR